MRFNEGDCIICSDEAECVKRSISMVTAGYNIEIKPVIMVRGVPGHDKTNEQA